MSLPSSSLGFFSVLVQVYSQGRSLGMWYLGQTLICFLKCDISQVSLAKSYCPSSSASEFWFLHALRVLGVSGTQVECVHKKHYVSLRHFLSE